MISLFSKVINKNPRVIARSMAKLMNRGKIVWMDCEMTGLEVDECRVIQAAMLVTDENLSVVSPDFCVVINQNDSVLDNMNDWCKENLKDLAEASRNSKITEPIAEEMMLDYLKKHVEVGSSPLAGNTIYMDRLFLRKYFPRVDSYLHYRIIDVSTVKELCGRWNRRVYDTAPKKLLKHRALEDIKESINELKHYKENFFKVA